MKFWKMNGAGNDFIILNNLEERLPLEAIPQIARTLCRRRMSIGADGLMVVEAADQGGDFKMLFFNSDGSVGEMCGNGARCICRYGFENGLAKEAQAVETTAGMVFGRRIDRRLYRVRLNDPATIKLDCPVEVDGVRYACSYVELGDPGLPHAVVPYHNLQNADENELRELGRKIRWNPAFPKGQCELLRAHRGGPLFRADLRAGGGGLYLRLRHGHRVRSGGAGPSGKGQRAAGPGGHDRRDAVCGRGAGPQPDYGALPYRAHQRGLHRRGCGRGFDVSAIV